MKRGQNKSGFTVVELLIVIAVIVLLSTIGSIAYRGYREKATAAVAQSDYVQLAEKIESNITNTNYPASISECPTPSAANMCIQPKAGQTLRYYAFNPTSPRRALTSAHSTTTPAFELEVQNSDGFYFGSNAQMTSANEFLQYMDMTPMIDKYGLRKYKISFDIKSANTASANSFQVYMQNGSGAKYTFYSSVTATTSFERKTVIVTPTGPNAGFTESILAFYGTYSTGNIPTVKNVEIGPAF